MKCLSFQSQVFVHGLITYAGASLSLLENLEILLQKTKIFKICRTERIMKFEDLLLTLRIRSHL